MPGTVALSSLQSNFSESPNQYILTNYKVLCGQFFKIHAGKDLYYRIFFKAVPKLRELHWHAVNCKSS